MGFPIGIIFQLPRELAVMESQGNGEVKIGESYK